MTVGLRQECMIWTLTRTAAGMTQTSATRLGLREGLLSHRLNLQFKRYNCQEKGKTRVWWTFLNSNILLRLQRIVQILQTNRTKRIATMNPLLMRRRNFKSGKSQKSSWGMKSQYLSLAQKLTLNYFLRWTQMHHLMKMTFWNSLK